jgi:large exoprotein involved in heme utilization and adhesion
LFLMNPSGFVFGPNASLNVGASVSFTTAQYIRLLDGAFSSANFYANPANDGPANNSILAIDPGAFEFLSANPNAYGFLTAPNPIATITVQGSALSVPSGQSISLVGGKVVIEGGAQLSAPGGRIHLATTASPGEFASSPFESLANATTLEPSPNNPVDPESATSFTSFGKVSLALGSSIDVHGTSTVLIKGGQLVLSVNDATLNTSENSAQSNTISLSPGSSIATANSGTDLGVDVQLTASNVSLNGARIVTGSGGEDASGDVIIQGPEEAGGVATSVVLSGSSQIGSSIFGSGAGGKISIMAESLDLSGFSSIISSTNGSASNGNIVVSVHDAKLTDGSTFASDTAFAGEGVVGGKITVQGLQGSESKAASLILEGSGSGITATSFGTGKLGDIEVHAETLRMTDGAVIESGTPLDTASAGSIKIDAVSVSLSGGSIISSHTFNLDAGPVNITANQFSLDNSTIATNTSSPTGGLGGDVELKVGSASLTNGATINSSADNTGVAGNINILANGSVTMTNGSTIKASSDGSGNAGNVTIKAGNQFAMTDSSITTEASQASGGQVTITAPELVHLINSNIITSVAGSSADTTGGNITIDPQFVVLQNSQILAQAFAGSGGAITITSNVFLADPSSVVDASSDLGVSGVVDIRSPVSNISGLIGRLPESVLAAQALLRAACATRLAESQVSSFVERGRDSIPIGPDGLLATPYLPPSSEPSSQMGSVPVDSGREAWVGSSRTSGVQLRRLVGSESIPRVQLLSGGIACGS